MTRSSFRRLRSAATSRTTAAGAAGLYGLDIHECPVDARHFTIDLDGLAVLAERVQPRLITMGASLNLLPHPVREVREIADAVGADLLFDAAHACGMFAGRVWPNPLDLGADLMTMSTYKSLGGPAGGLLLTNRADLAERVDAIAYPGLTANFDAGKTAALAITLLDWLDGGREYATAMTTTASALAEALPPPGCRCSQPSGATPHRTSSPSMRASGTEVTEPHSSCATPTSWRAPSACPAATSGRDCGSGHPRSCAGA